MVIIGFLIKATMSERKAAWGGEGAVQRVLDWELGSWPTQLGRPCILQALLFLPVKWIELARGLSARKAGSEPGSKLLLSITL